MDKSVRINTAACSIPVTRPDLTPGAKKLSVLALDIVCCALESPVGKDMEAMTKVFNACVLITPQYSERINGLHAMVLMIGGKYHEAEELSYRNEDPVAQAVLACCTYFRSDNACITMAKEVLQKGDETAAQLIQGVFGSHLKD